MALLEQYDFTILELLFEENNKTDIKPSETYLQKICKKIIRKNKEAQKRHIFKRKMRKYKILDSVRIQDKIGIRILIPYTIEELDTMEKSIVNNYVNSMMKLEQIRALVVDEKLKKYIPVEYIIDGKFLMFLYLKEILEIAGKHHSISKKRMKVLVIDSEELKTEYLLDEIKEDLNYLTLVTERPEYFKDYIEEVYEESGLLISLIRKPLNSLVDGNIIINLDDKQDKNFRYFEKNGVYIDLSEMSGPMSYIITKRIDMTYYNHIIVLIKGEIVDNPIIQAAICGKPTRYCLENLEQFEKCEVIKVANLGCRY